MNSIDISDQEFAQFQRFIYDAAGISISSAKKALVGHRLWKRLENHGLTSYSAYFRMLASGTAPAEVQTAVDLLTTNETYFFREEVHFTFLRQRAMEAKDRFQPFRVWSAASSTGEEAYSIAMVLDDCLGARQWEIIGSDISTRVLAQARTAHYTEPRTSLIPANYRKRYCLKGTGVEAGTVLVTRSLRSRVTFQQVNLNEPLPNLGTFDLVFLRNVLIYFDEPTKKAVVSRLLSTLKPGGYFLIGHSETLNGINDSVTAIAPAIYRKP